MGRCAGDPRRTWQVLKQELGQPTRQLFLDHLVQENGIITDQTQIANAINNHFAGIGKEISDSFGSNRCPSSIHAPRCMNICALPTITSSDVIERSKSMKNNYAGCMADIPSAIIKKKHSDLG
jgi:hypothetical protein